MELIFRQIIKKFRKRKVSHRKGQSGAGKSGGVPWKRILAWGLGIGFGLAALGMLLLMSLFLYYSYGPDLPSVEALKNYKPQQSVRVLDRHGGLIAIVGRQRRTVVPYEKIPKVMVQAVLAAEDAQFFRHTGLNYTGMIRAFWVNLAAGRFKQGGSTITQQVVKGLLLTPERSLRRKFQEVILARRVEGALSKEQILAIYLNEIYFGHGRYGVEEAARFYFRKPISGINVAEAALLAALPQGPEVNSPIKHPEKARERQKYVLWQMARHGFITEQAVEAALAAPLLPGEPEIPDTMVAPELVTHLTEQYADTIRSAAGREIVTTLDLKLQTAAREALALELRELDRRQRVTRLTLLEGRKKADHMEKLRKIQVHHAGPIYEGVVVDREDGKLVVSVGNEQGVVVEQMERYYPAGFTWGPPPPPEKPAPRKKGDKKTPDKPAPPPSVQPGHLFRVRVLPGKSGSAKSPLRLRAELGPQGAVVVMHAATREVLAIVGGDAQGPGDFNRALAGLRQPGSSFKPFFYASAIMQKKLTPASILRDDPEVYQKWIPRSGHDFQGRITLRRALNMSLNTVAVQVLREAGLDAAVAFAESTGITTILRKDLSLALGSSEVRLIDMVGAYGVFPSGGLALPPQWIVRVGDQGVARPEFKRVMDPASAWLMTSLLRTVVTEGTAKRAAVLKFPVAGKTGTTNNNKDAWFIGFSPEIVCGVWIGYDDLKPLGSREEGGRSAVPVFVRVMKEAHKSREARDFFIPPGIVSREIDPGTGEAVLPSAAVRLTEYFLEGTEPEPASVAPDPLVAPDPDAPSAGDLLTQ